MIAPRQSRGSLRLRPLAWQSTPPARRKLSPAAVVAVALHAALVAGLAIWKAPALRTTTHSESFSTTVTFVGLREPTPVAGGVGSGGGRGGGNREAGGRGTQRAALRLAPMNTFRPEMPALAPPVARLKPVIAVEVSEPVPLTSFTPMRPPASAFAEGSVVGEAGGNGTGIGSGTGTGIGNGFADGVVGSGRSLGTGDGTGEGVGSDNGIGTGFGGANYLRSPQPHYPSLARQQGWEGTTVLRVEIHADGSIGVIQILQSSGHKILDDAAIEAVRAAQFQPARHNGVPVTSWVEIPVTFRLNRG